MADSSEEEFPWDLGVFDAHCHPTDTMDSVVDMSTMSTAAFTVMSTRAQDQDLVAQIAVDTKACSKECIVNAPAALKGNAIVPAYGWHPWFSHQIYDDTSPDSKTESAVPLNAEAKVLHYQNVLAPKSEDRDFLLSLPDPRPLSEFLKETSHRLSQNPVAILGEVGLDKAFRLPEDWLPAQREDRDESLTPGGREGRRLSRYRVQMAHQQKILLAQLGLAAELQRPVSLHGVQAHGILFDTLRETWKGQEKEVISKRERKRHGDNDMTDFSTAKAESARHPPRICLHSYSGPVETLKQYLHPSVPVEFFFSFSIVINFAKGTVNKSEQVIRALPDDKILIESDLHTAGPLMDTNIEMIARKVCDVKGWSLEHGVTQLGRNWKRFISGDSTT